MTIQQQIDARIAEIEAVLARKFGRPRMVNYALERHRSKHKVTISTAGEDWLTSDFILLAAAGDIDEALTLALAKAKTLRSVEDELSDLGLPVQPATEDAAA